MSRPVLESEDEIGFNPTDFTACWGKKTYTRIKEQFKTCGIKGFCGGI